MHEAETSADDVHNTIDIVAVHGPNDGPLSSWTHKSGVIWLTDILPKDLPNCRILPFGIDLIGRASILLLSPNSRLLLKSYLKLFPNSESSLTLYVCSPPSICTAHWHCPGRALEHWFFLAHSLGGIIVKEALLLASDTSRQSFRQILKATSGIVFFGTPNFGGLNDIERVLQYSVSHPKG